MLLNEPGAEVVRPHLAHAIVSVVNYAEVLGRAATLCGSLDEAKRRVDLHIPHVLPFDLAQATATASLLPSTRPLGLSLGDRACLALGLVRRLPILTADRRWADVPDAVVVELVR